MDRPYLSLIVPAYNEGFRMGATLETVRAYLDTLGHTYEIVAVNDGSTDDTGRVLLECARESASIRVVSYERNRGKGYAVRQGVFASRGEYVAFSDADLSAPIDQLSKLFGAIEKGYDVAIGSRAVKDTEILVHQPLYRELGGKSLNLVIQLLATPGIHDTQCGFKLFRSEVAQDVFKRCRLDGWDFDVEVLYLARKLGYKIAEIGVKWAHAEGSKISPFKAGLRAVVDLIGMRLRHYPDLTRNA